MARTTVPNVSNKKVIPGSDAVMCLSCHRPHASEYPDMLRLVLEAAIARQETGAG